MKMLGLSFVVFLTIISVALWGASPVSAAEKESSSTTSSPPEQRLASMLPNMNKELLGSYIYGPGYSAAQRGKSVSFELKTVQEEGSNRFEGVMNEPYTSFGTPKDKRLWADVRGEVINNGSSVKVRFTKTYRYFQQSPIIYEGGFDPSTSEIKGTWRISDGLASASGTFKMR